MRTGAILDFYDDPYGKVLKEKVAFAQLPECVKTAQLQTHEMRESLPDDAYALVMVDRGEKIRKYACVDKGNTALNVLYFLENKDKLPLDAQKIAAVNLEAYCDVFGIEAPWQLQKAAGNACAGKKCKGADVTGSEIMPLQANPNGKDSPDSQLNATKTASTYVDVTGKEAPIKLVKKAHSRYCLEKQGSGKYPIDTYGEVLDASKWFSDHGDSLHPSDRREYCVKLASRADELGVLIPDNIRKYAGTSYAPMEDVKFAVSTRMQFWADDSPERDMLSGLMSKCASIEPDVFCEALRQFDEATGMNHHYDTDVIDPWFATYALEKVAEWSWSEGADILKENQLVEGVGNAGNIYQIKERFGEDVASGLAKNPTAIFDSLPLDTKRIICRILVDTQ